MVGDTATGTFALEHYEKSVNNAAARVRGLWLGYIALVTYLIITVGAVTHRDLLLENPVKLPVLNVELSLIGFFAIAPIFFLINHFYLLLHLVGLRRRIREYNEAIRIAVETKKLRGIDEDIRRRDLDSFVIVQAFGGTSEERTGNTGLFLKAIIWITVVIAPIIVLQQMLLYFLPYHLEPVTWVHRIATIVDLAMLWLFWPGILHGLSKLTILRPWQSLPVLTAGLGSLVVVVSSLFIATFPGEWFDKFGFRSNSGLVLNSWETPKDRILWPIKSWLFEGGVNEVTGKRNGWLSRTLVIPNGDFVDDEKLAKQIERNRNDGKKPHQSVRTLSLRGRDLRGAVLLRADLRSVDFTGVHLEDAKMDFAQLQGSRFGCGRTSDVIHSIGPGDGPDDIWQCASLQGASLRRAKLQGASLDGARLQGASLNGASLQGASLVRASLQGASLDGASLQGVSLAGARLQGALLDGASLQGATLTFARLQGASLYVAKLHGASLVGAWLHGASFDLASLHGASLRSARFSMTGLNNTFLWRAKDVGKLNGSQINDPRMDLIPDVELDFYGEPKFSFEVMMKHALASTQDIQTQEMIRSRLAPLRLDAKSPEEDLEDVFFWMREAKQSPDESEYETLLASFLKDLGCDEENGPFVAQGIVMNRRVSATGAKAIALADHLLNANDATCPGAVGIQEEARASLRRIIKDHRQ